MGDSLSNVDLYTLQKPPAKDGFAKHGSHHMQVKIKRAGGRKSAEC